MRNYICNWEGTKTIDDWIGAWKSSQNFQMAQKGQNYRVERGRAQKDAAMEKMQNLPMDKRMRCKVTQ